MRSDAIRCDPSHRTHRRRTLLKIITALGSLGSWGTHTHIVVPQLVLSFAAVLLAVDFTCVPLSLSLPLTLTCCLAVPFALCRFDIYLFFYWTQVLSCVVAVSVSVSVSLNRSIWLILLTSFFRLLCSAAFYALYRLFCLDIMAFIYANVIYALSLSVSLSDIQIN